MRGIIGTNNAGFDIIEAMHTDARHGYCIGRTKTQYVTWWFIESPEGGEYRFYHGHYFPINPDAPFKTAATVKADYCRRLMEEYESLAKYGV